MAADLKAAVVRDAAGLAALGAEWDALLERAGRPSAFLESRWLRAWWSAYADGRELRVVTLRREGRLEAAAPLFVQRGRGLASLHLLGQGRLDELGCLVDAAAPDAWPALGSALAGLPEWDALELHSWSLGHDALERLVTGLGPGFAWAVRSYERCPFVSVDGTWEQGLAARTSRFRKWVRKVERKATGYGATRLECRRGSGIEPAHLRELAALESRSRHGRAGTGHFADPRFARMLEALLGEPDPPLELQLLRVDGRLVAAELLGLGGPSLLGLWTCFDAELPYTGTYVVNRAIQSAFERGAASFEFLQGDERYKLTWATGEREVLQACIARRRPAARLWLGARRLRWWAAGSRRLRPVLERLRSLAR